MTEMSERKKKPNEFKFTITFWNEEDRNEFRDKITSLKLKTGMPIYKIATQMLYDFIKQQRKL